MPEMKIEPDTLVARNNVGTPNSFDLLLWYTKDDLKKQPSCPDGKELRFSILKSNEACSIWLPLFPFANTPPEQKQRFLGESCTATGPEGWGATYHSVSGYGSLWSFTPPENARFDAAQQLRFSFKDIHTFSYYFTPGRASFVGVYFFGAPVRFLPLFVVSSPFSIPYFYPENGITHGVGDAVRLCWDVSGKRGESSHARLTPANMDADERNSVTVYPRCNTTYSVYAREGDSHLSRHLDITVKQGRIREFKVLTEVSLDKINYKLYAWLEGADHAWLDNGIGRVSAEALRNGIVVQPDKAETTYTLRVETENGFSEKKVPVTVRDQLMVEKFTVGMDSGQYCVIWKVKNADKVALKTLSNTVLSESHSGSLPCMPNQVLRLECSGKKEQKYSLTIIPS